MKTTQTVPFTAEMLKKLEDANSSVAGTNDYCEYYMEHEYLKRTGGGNEYWKFIGWGIPSTVLRLKSFLEQQD